MPSAVHNLGLAHYGPISANPLQATILLFSGTIEAWGRLFLFQSGVRAKSHPSLINLQAHCVLLIVDSQELAGL